MTSNLTQLAAAATSPSQAGASERGESVSNAWGLMGPGGGQQPCLSSPLQAPSDIKAILGISSAW